MRSVDELGLQVDVRERHRLQAGLDRQQDVEHVAIALGRDAAILREAWDGGSGERGGEGIIAIGEHQAGGALRDRGIGGDQPLRLDDGAGDPGRKRGMRRDPALTHDEALPRMRDRPPVDQHAEFSGRVALELEQVGRRRGAGGDLPGVEGGPQGGATAGDDDAKVAVGAQACFGNRPAQGVVGEAALRRDPEHLSFQGRQVRERRPGSVSYTHLDVYKRQDPQ